MGRGTMQPYITDSFDKKCLDRDYIEGKADIPFGKVKASKSNKYKEKEY